MWNKKGIFDSLLYLSLLTSILRVDDDYSQRRDNYGRSQGVLVSSSSNNYGETDIYSIYELSHDARRIQPPSKTSILIEETYDLFRELNSLGRYSRNNAYNTQLLAYLVNSDENQRNEPTCIVPSPVSTAPSSNSMCSSATHSLQSLSSAIGTRNADGSPPPSSPSSSSSVSDDERRSENHNDSQESGDGSLTQAGDGQSVREEGYISDGGIGGTGHLDGLEDLSLSSSSEDLIDEVLFSGIDLPLISDPLLSSIINDDNGDQSLFEELEKLILNTEEGDTNGTRQPSDTHWDSSWNTNLEASAGVETSSMLQQEAFLNSNYQNFYQYAGYHHYPGDQVAELPQDNSSHVIATTGHPPGPVNTFATAVAASMATLTNGSDPVPDICSSVAGYGAEFTDFSYTNASLTHNMTAAGAGIQIQNVSGDYSLSDFLSDEDLQLMDVSSVIQENGHAHHHHHHHHHQKVPVASNVTEDRMDASSDSAVSSMSSERVPSICEGDWIDSCSENSSHHGDQAFYGSQYEVRTAAQKKYKLFGKKTEFKQEPNAEASEPIAYEANYFDSMEYGQNVYSSVEGACAYASVGTNQAGAYVPIPLRNHTYHLPVPHRIEPRPLTKLALNNHNRRESTRSVSSRSSEKFSDDEDDDDLASCSSTAYVAGRDEKRARALKIPITTFDIVNLPIDEFNERLSKYELSEAQLSLIRDIRRRGKNKVAAQNCRKRKMDQIVGLQGEVGSLHDKKNELQYEQDQLISLRDLVRDKYTRLYNLVLESSKGVVGDSCRNACQPDYTQISVQQTNYSVNAGETFKPSTKRSPHL